MIPRPTQAARATLLAALLLMASAATAQDVSDVPGTADGLPDIAQIKLLRGDVRLLRGVLERPAQAGDWLRQADTIITGADGRVGLTFIDNTRFSAGPDSRIALETYRFNSTTHEGDFVARLERGTVAVSSGQLARYSPEQMKIRTPSSVLGVNGTRFVVQVAP